MVRDIVQDVIFLGRKSQAASREDLPTAQDLLDTLAAHRQECVGMAANMIGVLKNIIVVHTALGDEIFINPVIVQKSDPYATEEGCLSLTGMRQTTRYRKIVVVYEDMKLKKRRRTYTGWTAQIIQHECDHLAGILI